MKRCPHCNKIVKGHKNKKFCNSRCKDKFHNRANPRGYYAHLASADDYRGGTLDIHNEEDASWDAHKGSF